MTIYRIRRPTVHDEGVHYCDCCNKEFTKGFQIHLDDRNTAIRVCDDCLGAAKSSELGLHKSEEHNK